jgi:hypothetical protein
MTHRLGRLLGNGPDLWLNLQRSVDMWDALNMDTKCFEWIEPLKATTSESTPGAVFSVHCSGCNGRDMDKAAWMTSSTTEEKMYGVSANLPVNHFVGQTLDSVTLCRYQVSFNFDPDYVCAMGSWELRDPSGSLTDQEMATDLEIEISLRNRDGYSFHKIIGQDVTACEINPPLSFTLKFANNYSLTVFDDGEQYEFIQMSIANQIIYI